MALLTKTNLETMDYSYGGVPFVSVATKSGIDLDTMDYSFGGVPFWGAEVSGGGAQNLTLTCAAGSYSLTGTSVTLTHTPASQSLTLSCEGGSYSLTGTNAALTSSRTIVCEPASGGAYPDIIVSGAGTSGANGTWAYAGLHGGKPYYTKGEDVIVWLGSFWAINGYYYSLDDVATPDLVTTWTVYTSGIAPVPTVTVATTYTLTGSDVTLTYTQGAQNLTLTCESGSYSLTGSGVILTSKHKNLANANIVVSGAGLDEVNGGYVEAGVINGRHYYTYEKYQIFWNGSVWLIFYPSQSLYQYGSLDNVATPDLCTTWSARSGVPLPLPAVTVGVKGDGTIHSEMECEAGAHSLTGTNATLTVQRNFVLECQAGSYTLTGSDATLDPTFHYSLTCGAGSYALTGTDISFGNTTAYTLTCASGSYSLTGSDISFAIQRNYTFVCEAGSYSLTGTDADLILQRNYTLEAEQGNYALTGADVSITASISTRYELTCSAGIYNLTGNPITISKGLNLALGGGLYTLTGSNINLPFGRILSANAGNYSLSGKGIDFTKSLIFTLDSGLYILTGSDAYFITGTTVTPPCRTFVIVAENRVFVIPSENRTFEIEAGRLPRGGVD